LGQAGSGKTRLCRVLGDLAYKPYRTNASTTEAALFRGLGRLGLCTMVLDENEHLDNDRTQSAITRILKVGFDDSFPWVTRCEEMPKGGSQSYEPRSYYVFGPKIIAAIDHVPDKALRSRCISIRMVKSRDVAGELPAQYEREVTELRAMLVQYRLDHGLAMPADPMLHEVDLRLMQLYRPLARVATGDQLRTLQDLVREMQAEIDEEDSTSKDQLVAASLGSLIEDGTEWPPDYDQIRERARDRGGMVDAQAIGQCLKGLGIKTNRAPNHKGPRRVAATKEEVVGTLRESGLAPDPPARAS
jgi:hypothetical protein